MKARVAITFWIWLLCSIELWLEGKARGEWWWWLILRFIEVNDLMDFRMLLIGC